MPRSSATAKQKVVTELRRAEILTAATKVFGNKGFDDTLMDEIARAAGLAKGTLYLYFKSKDDIYQAVVRHALAQVDALTQQHVDASPTFAARFSAFIRVRIAFWQDHHLLYRVILSMGRAPQYRKKSIGWQREAVSYLVRVMEEGAAAREIPPQDFLAAAWMTMDAIRGANERRVFADCDSNTVEQDVEALTSLLLQAVQPRQS
ncbi:MAG: TetR/AcrR family transcriptional regulator [Edaphobacter sp.]|uniref:TetR/AcrR family transcriptional regulator n=1 Tax=Edaphobacter sp. TaxID=1934404 RepID=UPI0023894B9B|nr:TetR/AcrR family transcriptional regulator [Edaphobacter sp.]MDE1178497.1 TetR/AcrR family transcriptional regulator [Edaphobacter sp.]